MYRCIVDGREIQRKRSTLDRTLESLSCAGFSSPRLFIDGCSYKQAGAYEKYDLPLTLRDPPLLTFGNWLLSLWEIYQRQPHAKRYALFQDDVIFVSHLREYLESVEFPERSYLNLYTTASNRKTRGGAIGRGWYRPRWRGRGALALVFTSEGARKLLAQPHMIDRPMSTRRDRPAHKFVDGAIVDAMRKCELKEHGGWKEYVYEQSLCQHIGHVSSMGNGKQPYAKSFPGEDFDARELITEGGEDEDS